METHEVKDLSVERQSGYDVGKNKCLAIRLTKGAKLQ
jgi:hypothetical protein